MHVDVTSFMYSLRCQKPRRPWYIAPRPWERLPSLSVVNSSFASYPRCHKLDHSLRTNSNHVARPIARGVVTWAKVHHDRLDASGKKKNWEQLLARKACTPLLLILFALAEAGCVHVPSNLPRFLPSRDSALGCLDYVKLGVYQCNTGKLQPLRTCRSSRFFIHVRNSLRHPVSAFL